MSWCLSNLDKCLPTHSKMMIIASMIIIEWEDES